MSPRRRPRSSGPPRCQDCNAVIVFFRSPITDQLRPFDPRPVDPFQQRAVAAYPVLNGHTAWTLEDFVEHRMVHLGVTREEAEDEAHDLPWHIPHHCPNRPQERDQ